jgi:hypothetical protein
MRCNCGLAVALCGKVEKKSTMKVDKAKFDAILRKMLAAKPPEKKPRPKPQK